MSETNQPFICDYVVTDVEVPKALKAPKPAINIPTHPTDPVKNTVSLKVQLEALLPTIKQTIPKQFQAAISVITELSEGNINQVFHVKLENDFSFIVKYAPPFAYRYQMLAIANQRNAFEANVIVHNRQTNPHAYADVYYYNADLSLMLMQDLTPCQVMNDTLIQGRQFAHFENQVIAALSAMMTNKPGATSPDDLPFSYQHGMPALQQITRDYVFRYPFGLQRPDGVICLPDNLDWIKTNILGNSALLERRHELEVCYFNKQQTLIHGDLHTGSIMLDAEHCYFIDLEFAKLGPISFDLGTLIGNLVMSLAASHYHLRHDADQKQLFQTWLIDCITTLLTSGIRQLAADGLDQNELLLETLGFCGIEIIRRTIGEGKIKDFSLISDMQQRAGIERRALAFAVKCMETSKQSNAIEITQALLVELYSERF